MRTHDGPVDLDQSRHRWETISRHLAHASWKEARSPRQFNVEKIVNVLGALDLFVTALGAQGGAEPLADQLGADVIRAKEVAVRGIFESKPIII